MYAPLPLRVRQAIVHLAESEGRTYGQISRLLGVGPASVSRILRLHREKGTLEPEPPRGGNFSPIQGRVVDLLRRIVEELPDATVKEITDALLAEGVETSKSAVQRSLHRLDFSLKKSPSSPASGTRRRTGRRGARSAP